MDNFGRNFTGAVIGGYMGIFGLIFKNYFWATTGALVMACFIFIIVIEVIIECEKESVTNHKFNWTCYCATCTNRNQCSEESCTMYNICLIKDVSQFTRKVKA